MTLAELKKGIKVWVKTNIPLDDLSDLVDITHENPKNVYSYMNLYGIDGDSMVREWIFNYISIKHYGGNYDVIYNKWLGIKK